MVPEEPPAADGRPVDAALDVPDATLRRLLDEDLGVPWHDVTTDTLFSDQSGAARLVAREPARVSGVALAARIFRMAGAEADLLVADGNDVAAATTLLRVHGPVRALLRAERTALNLVARMSGIASLTAEAQARASAQAPGCRVAATRKTTPGFRVFEKLAVVHGGGDPHRFGLFDQVLVKDNHRAAVPDLATALEHLRNANPGLIIEVEVEDVTEAETAARAGVDWILIDNHDPLAFATLARRVRELAPDVRIEASGGITLDRIADYAPFADRVSMGALTMAAVAVDVGLDWGANRAQMS